MDDGISKWSQEDSSAPTTRNIQGEAKTASTGIQNTRRRRHTHRIIQIDKRPKVKL
jgi:hypothetical protein